MSPIVNTLAVVVLLSVAIAVRARGGTLRDGRFSASVVLWFLAVWGSYGSGGHPWPGGPWIVEDIQALMVLAGLVAAVAALVLSVLIALRPRRPEPRSAGVAPR